MAAVEVTISGVLYDKVNRTMQNVVLIGEASLTGVGIGGGPIYPPAKPPGDGKPPGIWGGPIDPYPGHPLPEPPPGAGEKPPIDPGAPPVTWKAVWHPTEGWIVVGVINPEVEHPVPST